MYRELKMGRGALSLGLKELVEEGIIKKDVYRYSIQTKPTKNKILSDVEDRKLMDFDLDKAMEELRVNEEPFVLGYTLLRSAMFSLPKFTLELHSTRLTKQEKEELKKIIERCNQTIRRTFEILEGLDFTQTLALKQGLDNAMTIPGYERKMFSKATNRQQRRGIKIAKKINAHVLK